MRREGGKKVQKKCECVWHAGLALREAFTTDEMDAGKQTAGWRDSHAGLASGCRHQPEFLGSHNGKPATVHAQLLEEISDVAFHRYG